MILDKGIAFFHRIINIAAPGSMPVEAPEEKAYYAAYFGELSFETAPARPTPNREEVKTDARIRVLQNREIRNAHAAFLSVGETLKRYKVTRVYHGKDDESGEDISDVNLEALDHD